MCNCVSEPNMSYGAAPPLGTVGPVVQLCLRDQWVLWCSSTLLLIEQHPQNKKARLVSTIWFPGISCVFLVIGESRLAEEHAEIA